MPAYVAGEEIIGPLQVTMFLEQLHTEIKDPIKHNIKLQDKHSLTKKYGIILFYTKDSKQPKKLIFMKIN